MGRAPALTEDRDTLLSQVMSLPFVFETDASNTDRFLQPPRSPTAPGYKYGLESAAPSSDPSLPQDTTEVLLFGLKSDTWYKATVYPRAANGVEGQPRTTEFKTSMLNFVKWLQPEFSSTEFVFCDSGSELSLAS